MNPAATQALAEIDRWLSQDDRREVLVVRSDRTWHLEITIDQTCTDTTLCGGISDDIGDSIVLARDAMKNEGWL
jgi:hypothetical protein